MSVDLQALLNLTTALEGSDQLAPEALLQQAYPVLETLLHGARFLRLYLLSDDNTLRVVLPARGAARVMLPTVATPEYDPARDLWSVPLLAQDQLLGLLEVGLPADTDGALFTYLSHHLARALHAAQFGVMLRHVGQFNAEITRTRSFTEIAAVIARHVADRGQFISINLFRYDAEGRGMGFETVATANRRESFEARLLLPLAPQEFEQNMGALFRQSHYFIEDVATDTVITDATRLGLLAVHVKSVLLLPLNYGEHIVGFVGINSTTEPLRYSPARLNFYRSLVNQASAVVQAQRLMESSAAAAEVGERRAAAARDLLAARDLAQMAHVIARHMLPQPGRYLSINRLERGARGDVTGLHTLASANRDRALVVEQQLLLRWEDIHPVLRDRALDGEPLWIADLDAVAPEDIGEGLHYWMRQNNVQSLLNLTLFVDAQPLALLSVLSRERAEFARDEIGAFQSLADQLANLIYIHDLREGVERTRAVVDGLVLASRMISTAEGYGDMAQAVLSTVARSMTAVALTLFDPLVTPDNVPLSRALVVVATPDGLLPADDPAPLVDDLPAPDQLNDLRRGVPVVVDLDEYGAFPSANRRQQYGDIGAAWLASFGLRSGDRLLGTLDVLHARDYHFGAEEVDALVTLADQIGVTLLSRQLLAETRAAQAQGITLAPNLVSANRMISEAENYGKMGAAVLQTIPTLVTAVAIALFDRAITIQGMPGKLITDYLATRQDFRELRLVDDFPPASNEDPRITLIMRRMLEGHPWLVKPQHRVPPPMGQKAVAALAEQGAQFITGLGLIVNMKLLGVVLYASDLEQELPAEQMDVLRAVTDQVAVTLENRDLLRQTADALGFVQTQYETTSKLYRSDNRVELLEAIYNFSGKLYEQAHLALVEPGSNPTVVNVVAEIDGKGARAVNRTGALSQYPAADGLPAMDTFDVPDVGRSKFLRPAERAALVEQKIQALLILPLVLNQRLTGLLYLANPTPVQIPTNRLRALRSMTDQLAVKFENQSLLKSTADTLAEVRTLYNANRSMLGAQDMLDMLRALRASLAPDAAAITHYQVARDAQNRIAHVTQCHTLTPTTEESRDVPLDARFTPDRLAALTAYWDRGGTRVIFTEDTTRATTENPMVFIVGGLSLITILVREAGLEDMIIISYDRPRRFDVQMRRLYEALTDQIIVVLQKQRFLIEAQTSALQLSSQVRVLQTLNQFSTQMTNIRDETVLLQRACQSLTTALGADHSGAVLLDPGGSTGTVVTEYPEQGSIGVRLDMLNDPLQRQARDTLQPTIVDDIDSDPRVSENNRALMREAGLKSMLIIPLTDVDGHYIGSVGVDLYTRARRFTQDSLEIAQTIASGVAVGLQNIRLLAEAEERAAQLESQVRALETLNEMAAIITSRRTEKKLFEDSAHALVRALNVDHCGIILMDPSGTVGTIAGEFPARGMVGVEINMETDPIHLRIRSTRQPVFVEDTQTFPEVDDATRQMWRQYNIVSVLVIPLIDVNGRLIGSVGLDMYDQSHVITPDMTDVATTITAQIGVGLQNIRLLQDAERRAEQLQRITSFSQSVQATLDMASIYEIALSENTRMIAMSHMNIALLDEDGSTLRAVAQFYRGRTHIDLFSGPTVAMDGTPIGRAWFEKRLVYIPDMRGERALRHPYSDTRAVLVAPLFSRGALRGVVEVGVNRPNAYNEADQAVFQQMVNQLNVAVENAEAFSQSQKLAQNKALASEISAQLQRQADMEKILAVTAQELGKALGAKRARIRLGTGSK